MYCQPLAAFDDRGLERLEEHVVSIEDIDDVALHMDESFAEKDRIARALMLLPERYERILRQRYGMNGRQACEPMSVEELAEVYGATKTRVYQMVRTAQDKLKRVMFVERRLTAEESLVVRAEQARLDQEADEKRKSVEVMLAARERTQAAAAIERRMREQCRRNVEALEAQIRARKVVSADFAVSWSTEQVSATLSGEEIAKAAEVRDALPSPRALIEKHGRRRAGAWDTRLISAKLLDMLALTLATILGGGFAIMSVAGILAQVHYETARVLFYSGPVLMAMVLFPGYMAITRRSRDWYGKRYDDWRELVVVDDTKGRHRHCWKSYIPLDIGRIG